MYQPIPRSSDWFHSYGDSVHARRWIAIGLRNTTGTERRANFPPVVDDYSPLSACLDGWNNVRAQSLFTFRNNQAMWNPPSPPHLADNIFPRTVFTVTTNAVTDKPIFIQNPDCSAPEPCSRHDGTALQRSFGIPFTDAFGINSVRPATEHEILMTYSFLITAIQQLDDQRLLSAAVDRVQAGLPFRIAAALIVVPRQLH